MKLNINPSTQKIGIWLLLAITAIIVVDQAIKAWQKLQAAKNANQVANDLNSGNLTYNITQYTIYADKIGEAIGYFYSDTSAVKDVFNRMNNADDVKQLIKAFGTRSYVFYSGPKSLPEFLSAGLNNSVITEINQILASKNINMSF